MLEFYNVSSGKGNFNEVGLKDGDWVEVFKNYSM